MEDIDAISSQLGIPWERSKDILLGKNIPFIGFDWDLKGKTVSLQEKMKEKYQTAVEEWRKQQTHTLQGVLKLSSKLLHMCLIVPEGWTYLTKLEIMVRIFHDTPDKPHHQPHQTDCDLLWWL